MRKFIVLLLLLSVCYVKADAQYVTARSYVVIKDNSRKEAKEAAKAEKEAAAKAEAERKAQEEARLAAEREAAEKAEAERKAQEQARLAAEKEAAAKAKAEEQARIAAEKEAAAKAKAEEQARLAAEKEAAAKAKAEADRIAAEREAERAATEKTKAEELARLKAQLMAELMAEMKAKENTKKQTGLTAEREATAKAKAEEKRQIAEQKSSKLDNSNAEVEQPSKMKFGQHVSVGYSFVAGPKSQVGGLNYIAGLQFNKYLYLGIGTGVNINSDGPWGPNVNRSYYNTYGAMSRISIPVFLHFRTDFAFGKRWNPYAAISLGGEFSTQAIGQEGYLYDNNRKFIAYGKVIDHCHYVTTNIAIGANCKINKKLSLYFGINAGFDFDNFSIQVNKAWAYSDYATIDIYNGISLNRFVAKFNIGLCF